MGPLLAIDANDIVPSYFESGKLPSRLLSLQPALAALREQPLVWPG